MEGGGYAYTDGPELSSWLNTLSWGIDGSQVNAGDTFTLKLLCTFNFITSSPIVDLKVGDNVYATCIFNPGYVTVPYSSMECTASNNVTPQTRATGTVSFAVTYNAGGSGGASDLQDSTCFTTGINTITYEDGPNKISYAVNMNGGIGSQNAYNPSDLAYWSMLLPDINMQQNYVLAGDCPGGYTSGVLGLKVIGQDMDCDSIHSLISDSFNPWYFPTSTSTNFQYTTTCNPTDGVTMTFLNVPAGFRPFVDGLATLAKGSYTVQYTNKYTCTNGNIKTTVTR